MVTRRIPSVTPVYNLVAKVGILGVPSLSASEEQIGPDADIRKQKNPLVDKFLFSPSLIEHLVDAVGSLISVCPFGFIVDWDAEIPQ